MADEDQPNPEVESRKTRAEQMLGLREGRRSPIRGLEMRKTSAGLTLSGYASVFNVPYDVGWYTETVAPGSFSKTLADGADVQLLVNHEGLPLARTASKTLELTEDAKGLRVRATLDPEDPDVRRLAGKMDRGDLDEMSMGFWAKRQEWNDDYTERELQEIKLDRGDVSVVNFGANPATAGIEIRSRELLQRLVTLNPEEALAELRNAGQDDPVKVLESAQETLGRILTAARPAPDIEENIELFQARLRAIAI